MKNRALPRLMITSLVCASRFQGVPVMGDPLCGNSDASLWCSEQEISQSQQWRGGGQSPEQNIGQYPNADLHTSQENNERRQDEWTRWYREHHHGNLGFAQDKSGANKSFRFDVANDGSYCVSRDGRVGQYKEFTDDGQAKPVGETITNHLFGDTCTLNDPEAAQQAQSEYERIITEMHTHLLELIRRTHT